MARLCQALLLFVVAMALQSSSVQAWDSLKVVRPFQDISSSYVYVQQAVWYAMKEYNKASKDEYSFRVVEILKSQEQVTDSLDYYIEAKIARTMCKKTVGETDHCLFQKNPSMKKGFSEEQTHRLTSCPGLPRTEVFLGYGPSGPNVFAAFLVDFL